MSYRIFEDSNGKYKGNAEYQYVNPAGMGIEVLDPTNLYVVGGRALGKTTQIIARRSIRINKSMPGAYIAFIGDYYTNLLSNTVPSMIKGWNDLGYKEGKHYVVNDRPPKKFDEPYKKPISYKHTISWANGCFYKLVSMDVISSSAGDSYQHGLGDESKYLDKKKLDKLFPAVRGERMRFGSSPYYLGKTFTTDMPNLLRINEFDWILDQAQNMNVERLKLVLHASLTVNQISIELLKARVEKDVLSIKRLERLLYRWKLRLAKAQKNTTLFLLMSSYTNIDILRLDWFKEQFEILGAEDYRTSILTMKPEIKQGEKFYPYLSAKNFYDDGLILEFYHQFGFGDSAILTSDGLKYINTRQKLEGGMDFGDMISLVVGQEQGWVQRILKDFHTLEQSEVAIAKQFRDFFKNHKMKILDLYYDRSGNQYQKVGRDWASAVKNAIEFENDRPTGWKVNLMSVGQATILQEEEFNMMKAMLSETNSKLPKLLIDQVQCRNLKSSMEVAKQIIKADRKGVRRIHKDKSSESIPMARRPMWSTNLSDALKYYICRPKYMNIMKNRSFGGGSYEPVTH